MAFRQEKEEGSLLDGWAGPAPPLFTALNGALRNPDQIGQLSLAQFKLGADSLEVDVGFIWHLKIPDLVEPAGDPDNEQVALLDLAPADLLSPTVCIYH